MGHLDLQKRAIGCSQTSLAVTSNLLSLSATRQHIECSTDYQHCDAAVILSCLSCHWVNDLPVRCHTPQLSCLLCHCCACMQYDCISFPCGQGLLDTGSRQCVGLACSLTCFYPCSSASTDPRTSLVIERRHNLSLTCIHVS